MTDKPIKYTSVRNFQRSEKVDRRFLSQLVNKKLKGIISAVHVASVFGILIDELIIQLKETGSIQIDNFGTFRTKQMQSRRHYNFWIKDYCFSQGKNIIRFQPDLLLKKILTSNIDIDKTFPPNDIKK